MEGWDIDGGEGEKERGKDLNSAILFDMGKIFFTCTEY